MQCLIVCPLATWPRSMSPCSQGARRLSCNLKRLPVVALIGLIGLSGGCTGKSSQSAVINCKAQLMQNCLREAENALEVDKVLVPTTDAHTSFRFKGGQVHPTGELG